MNSFQWPLMHNNLTREDLDAVISLLKTDNPKLTHGPKVSEFEKAWSSWLGVKHSIMLNSGSSANDLTMLALKHLKGCGEVIVPPLTWVSDIASVLHAGHQPVFVDINPHTLAIDTDLVLQAITPRTKAVFLTHVLGYDGLTDKLIAELRERNILLIEDVCESHGATHNGQKLGSFGWASNFSFYYAHHLTTIEGGIVSTNDDDLYECLRMLRSHGLVRESTSIRLRDQYQKKYPDLNSDFIFAFPSHNMRPTEINAILGLSQLERLDHNNSLRDKNLRTFIGLLNSETYKTDFLLDGNSNYAFTLVLRQPDFILRNKVESALTLHGIEFRRGLSGGGNQLRQPYLRNANSFPSPESFPIVEHIHHFGWYIGNYPGLPSEKIEWLSSILNSLS